MLKFLKGLFQSSSPAEDREKRVSPRVHILEFHQISFKALRPPAEEHLTLTDLSSHGIGFQNAPDFPWPEEGDELSGFLIFNQVKYFIELRIVRKTEDTVGCSIERTGPTISDIITQHFQIELSARDLHQVDSSLLRPSTEGEPWWYIGGDGNEIYLIEQEGKLLRFHMSIDKKYLEYTSEGVLKYAQIEGTGGPLNMVKASNLLHFESEVPSEAVEEALRFVANLDQIRKSFKEEITSVLKKNTPV